VKRWGFRLKDFEERELPLSDELLERLMAYKREHAGSSTLIFPKDKKPDGHFLRTLKRQAPSCRLELWQLRWMLGKIEGVRTLVSAQVQGDFLHKNASQSRY